MKHELSDCNGGHGCAGRDCACPCHFDSEQYADEIDDRDESPIEWSNEVAERWDFDSDPDWR